MILTAENTSEAGKPCMLFDADGQQIEYVFQADTETGLVGQYVRDENGRLQDDGQDMMREFVHYKPPLSVMWIEK